MARLTNFKLGIRIEDDDPHQPQAPWMAHKSKTNSRSINKIGRGIPRYTCYLAHQLQGQKVKSQGHLPTNADTQNVPYLPNGKA